MVRNKRTNWNKYLNKLVIRYSFKSDPPRRNYRKRMYAIWNEIGDFELNKQKLVWLVRMISTKNWFSN